MEVIAAAPNPDGQAYFVPRWTLLDKIDSHMVAEQRAGKVRAQIESNFERHKHLIRDGVAELFGTAPGETVFIVGSGPSLNRNGQCLARMPGARIIAINGALAYLTEVGRKPDYYFTLDWLGRKEWLEGVDTSGVTLISSVTCPPDVINRFRSYKHFVGMTLTSGSEEEINRKYAYLGQLDAGLTATYSAMHLAYRMGAEKIVLVGQDFAFTDGLYHWNERCPAGLLEDRKAYPTTDINGYGTFTDYQLDRNMSLIRAAAMWCAEDGLEGINATEGGILDWNNRKLVDVVSEVRARALVEV